MKLWIIIIGVLLVIGSVVRMILGGISSSITIADVILLGIIPAFIGMGLIWGKRIAVLGYSILYLLGWIFGFYIGLSFVVILIAMTFPTIITMYLWKNIGEFD